MKKGIELGENEKATNDLSSLESVTENNTSLVDFIINEELEFFFTIITTDCYSGFLLESGFTVSSEEKTVYYSSLKEINDDFKKILIKNRGLFCEMITFLPKDIKYKIEERSFCSYKDEEALLDIALFKEITKGFFCLFDYSFKESDTHIKKAEKEAEEKAKKKAEEEAKEKAEEEAKEKAEEKVKEEAKERAKEKRTKKRKKNRENTKQAKIKVNETLSEENERLKEENERLKVDYGVLNQENNFKEKKDYFEYFISDKGRKRLLFLGISIDGKKVLYSQSYSNILRRTILGKNFSTIVKRIYNCFNENEKERAQSCKGKKDLAAEKNFIEVFIVLFSNYGYTFEYKKNDKSD